MIYIQTDECRMDIHADGTCTSSQEENKKDVSDNQMDKMMSTPPSKKNLKGKQYRLTFWDAWFKLQK